MKLHLQELLPVGRVVRPRRSFRQDGNNPTTSPAERKGGFRQSSATFRRLCQGLAKPLQAVCQSLAILALVCQTLANSSCTSYRAAMADLGLASRAAIETTPGFDTLPEARE